MSPEAIPADASARSPSMEEVLLESARLHAMRASILRFEAERARPRTPFLRRLSAARVGHRVRFAALVARRTVRSLIEDGPSATIDRLRVHLLGGPARRPVGPVTRVARATQQAVAADIAAAKRRVPVARLPSRETRDPAHDIYRLPIGDPAARMLRHRVLIVAELSIPQCAKYRVWQKQEQFERIGIPCTVVAWRRVPEVLSLLQTHTLAILYRVPGFTGPLDVIEEARRVGVETIWEIDDLIFDVDLYGANANLADLTPALRREVLNNAADYRRAMLACDRTIGSTSVLSALMAEASGKPSHVVSNALDAETLAFARLAAAARVRGDGRVVIAYGSGTLTHDTDFLAAGAALLRLMREDARVHLRIIGTLNLSSGFDAFADRIERFETTNFKAYLTALAACDISLAPLEASTFNDAKSNIKLLEASIVGLPSVCSPRAEFRAAIENGVDGFLAETEVEWHEALRLLSADTERRHAVAARARERAMTQYGPDAIASTLRPLASLMAPRERRRLRILVVNIFFSPRSFGGATVVAEEMAIRLAARDDTEIFVVSSHGFPAHQYTIRRYRTRGLDVFGVAMPNTRDEILNFDDPEMGRRFADILEAVEPDVVHLHAVQHFGAGIARACQIARVPYVVTVHDAWWLCQRQFMVRADNTYCYQTTIDLKVCERCLPDTHHLQSRMDILMQALKGAARILSPSASHGALYRANGIPAEQLVVNRNGIKLPGRPRPARAPGPLRFGYVGGNDPLKGMTLIREAFAGLDRSDWVLVIVDNTLNLGFSNFKHVRWSVKGDVRIVPAYRQDTMDAFFEGIDVLLFPSQWKESFGLTVREALARDVWVLATESGGAAEDIVVGENGSLIPMGNDPAPLAAAVTSILDRASMFDGFVNPYKRRLATLEDQAGELHDILLETALPDGGDAARHEHQLA